VVGGSVEVSMREWVIRRLLRFACARLWAGPIQKSRPEKHHNEAQAQRKDMSLFIFLGEKKRGQER